MEQDGQKDFGFGLVEQAHGGTSLSLSSMRISFNYVTSYHSAFSIVLVWTVENDAKTVVCTWIDECVLDYTENEYFWKRISVDGALVNKSAKVDEIKAYETIVIS